MMPRSRWQDRIVVEPDLHHGVPCIKGTRVPVATILGSLADGMSAEEVIVQFPQLTKDDIGAALSYAAEVLRQEIVLPMSA
ncbi:MAG: DUF433 domain-containing protein [Armatimonadota bacterium]|nr:DUF433 domain-containing protein [Armatimonadota bacterium]